MKEGLRANFSFLVPFACFVCWCGLFHATAFVAGQTAGWVAFAAAVIVTVLAFAFSERLERHKRAQVALASVAVRESLEEELLAEEALEKEKSSKKQHVKLLKRVEAARVANRDSRRSQSSAKGGADDEDTLPVHLHAFAKGVAVLASPSVSAAEVAGSGGEGSSGRKSKGSKHSVVDEEWS